MSENEEYKIIIEMGTSNNTWFKTEYTLEEFKSTYATEYVLVTVEDPFKYILNISNKEICEKVLNDFKIKNKERYICNNTKNSNRKPITYKPSYQQMQLVPNKTGKYLYKLACERAGVEPD